MAGKQAKKKQEIPKFIKSGPVPQIRDLSKLQTSQLTIGEKVIVFIEGYCLVPEGQLVGKPVVLDFFQKLFILAIYDNPEITDEALLSMARKNGKTALIGLIMLANLVGPVAMQNSRIISGAMSRDQAAEVYNFASKCVQISPKLQNLVKIIPSQKKMVGLPMNVEYQAISADSQTAHGKSPILAILDELGQIRGPQSDFVDAITTAQGAYENPLLIAISTQSANDADLFSIMIDDAENNKPRKTVCHVHAAEKDAKVEDEQAWKDANPAIGKFRSLNDVKKQADKAKRMPSFENTFRNLILNQRVSSTTPFISRDVWEKNGMEPHPLESLKNIYGGLDLSGRTDLTCLLLMGESEDDDFLHVHPFFWTPEEGIIDRAKRDRAPYDVWVKKGFLRTTPGHTVDYNFIVDEISNDILEKCDITNVAFDRWRIDIFKKACEDIGLVLPLSAHGQGYKDMSPALDALESDLLNARICHGMHPVLTYCAGNAVITRDPAGSRKLDKSKATGRIDGLQAMAMAEGARLGEVKDEEKSYDMYFI